MSEKSAKKRVAGGPQHQSAWSPLSLFSLKVFVQVAFNVVALFAVLAQRGRSRHVVRLSLLRSCHGALFLCAGYDAGGKGGGRGRKKREVEEEKKKEEGERERKAKTASRIICPG